MTISAIHATIRSGFAAGMLAAGCTVPVAYDNADVGSSSKASGWCRLSIRPRDCEQIRLSHPTKKLRTYGVVVVGIFTKADQGDGAGLALVDTVSAIFRSQTLGTTTKVHFRAPYVSHTSREGGWWMQNVTIPWWSDEDYTV